MNHTYTTTRYTFNKKFEVSTDTKTPPKPNEVRIKVAYCGICGTDVHIYHGMMDKRIREQRTIGHEMSGTIDAVGSQVSNFKVGTPVVVRPLDNRKEKPSDKGLSHICKELKFIGIDSPGAMQQYWNVPAFVVHQLPKDVDLKLAALTEPLAVACHDIRMSGLQKEETAVVLGGGPIGLLIALVARHLEAEVILSEVNQNRIDLALELGIRTINPIKEDLVNAVNETTQGRGADVVFEVAGVKSTLEVMTRVAGLRGRIVMVAIHGTPQPVDLFQFFWKELQLIGARVYEEADYEEAIKFIGQDVLPLAKLVTDVRPLSDIQSAFEAIDRSPDSMKTLLDCQ